MHLLHGIKRSRELDEAVIDQHVQHSMASEAVRAAWPALPLSVEGPAQNVIALADCRRRLSQGQQH